MSKSEINEQPKIKLFKGVYKNEKVLYKFIEVDEILQ